MTHGEGVSEQYVSARKGTLGIARASNNSNERVDRLRNGAVEMGATLCAIH
jgi:hypothetical protein